MTPHYITMPSSLQRNVLHLVLDMYKYLINALLKTAAAGGALRVQDMSDKYENVVMFNIAAPPQC